MSYVKRVAKMVVTFGIVVLAAASLLAGALIAAAQTGKTIDLPSGASL